MDVSIEVLGKNYKCSMCHNRYGEGKINILLSDTDMSTKEDVCNMEHDVTLCPHCFREAIDTTKIQLVKIIMEDWED